MKALVEGERGVLVEEQLFEVFPGCRAVSAGADPFGSADRGADAGDIFQGAQRLGFLRRQAGHPGVAVHHRAELLLLLLPQAAPQLFVFHIS